MNILSIQSQVVFGHVGNAAAAPTLHQMGCEVWPVPTVLFASHLGYGPEAGVRLAPATVAEILDGLEARGALHAADAVLTGFLGDKAMGSVALDAAARVRAANPHALFCCDPVLGDVEEGLYVDADLVSFYRHAVIPAADIITPNRFELALLAERVVERVADADAAARDMLAKGPETVLVTGLTGAENSIHMLAVNEAESWEVATPELTLRESVKGTGDIVSALFLACRLGGHGMVEALRRTASGVFAILEETVRQDAGEPRIIAARAHLSPDRGPVFDARRVR